MSTSAHSGKTEAAYQQALTALFARTTGAWRLGLERVSGFLGRLGNPHHAYPVFHIAGTNGKGSTVATLDALLRGAGFRVGRYTSPHLVDFRERIVVNGVPMAPDAIVEFLHRWDPEAASLGTTFFEVTTAMALWYFAEAKVDVAVVEVGLGGRLDATNVVEPVAAAVTQIGLDHTDFLGSSHAEIASEKAGIFKRGAVAVVGESKAEVRARLVQHAIDAGASKVWVADRDWQATNVVVDATGTSFDFTMEGRSARLHTPLIGSFQAQNASVALAMLRGAGAPWVAAADRAPELLESVRLAGRFHRVGPYIFDVAHNPDGAATVAATLRGLEVPRPIVAVVSVLRDKDWQRILSALSDVVDRFILTNTPTAPESRAWEIDTVLSWAKSRALHVDVERDFDRCLVNAKEQGATVLVTGSFHTVGDAMERLQVDPLAR